MWSLTPWSVSLHRVWFCAVLAYAAQSLTPRCVSLHRDWLHAVLFCAESLFYQMYLRKNKYLNKTSLACLSGAQEGWIRGGKMAKCQKNLVTWPLYKVLSSFRHMLNLQSYYQLEEVLYTFRRLSTLRWMLNIQTYLKLLDYSSPFRRTFHYYMNAQHSDVLSTIIWMLNIQTYFPFLDAQHSDILSTLFVGSQTSFCVNYTSLYLAGVCLVHANRLMMEPFVNSWTRLEHLGSIQT